MRILMRSVRRTGLKSLRAMEPKLTRGHLVAATSTERLDMKATSLSSASTARRASTEEIKPSGPTDGKVPEDNQLSFDPLDAELIGQALLDIRAARDIEASTPAALARFRQLNDISFLRGGTEEINKHIAAMPVDQIGDLLNTHAPGYRRGGDFGVATKMNQGFMVMVEAIRARLDAETFKAEG